jgi:hypothetical protein
VSSATKRMGWVLAISLGLNLFLVGFGAMRFLGGNTPRAEARERSNERVEELLGPPTREMREQRVRIVQNREAARAQLSAEKFNRDTAFLALSELRTSIMMAQELLHEQILEKFPKVPLEERKKFADAHFFRESDKKHDTKSVPYRSPINEPPPGYTKDGRTIEEAQKHAEQAAKEAERERQQRLLERPPEPEPKPAE